MGILVDSTFFIAAERRKMNAKQALEFLDISFPDRPIAISVITLLELAHGVPRADNAVRSQLRQQFLDQIALAVDIYPISPAIALRAGNLSGSLAGEAFKLRLPISSSESRLWSSTTICLQTIFAILNEYPV